MRFWQLIKRLIVAMSPFPHCFRHQHQALENADIQYNHYLRLNACERLQRFRKAPVFSSSIPFH